MTKKSLTVLFADLAESANLYQTQGDLEAHQHVSESLRCMRKVIDSQKGRLLRTVGDAVLASFKSSNSAFQAAIGIQREHKKLNLPVRVGFHHGSVIQDDGDVYGSAVNLAARVAAFCEANEICTTEDTIRRLSIDYQSKSEYLDRVDFKGISVPIPVYRVQWEIDNAHTAVAIAQSHTDRKKTNLALFLLIGVEQFRLDNNNPMITFGRANDNDVSLNIEPASRNHASIELANGRFIIKDHSTNGTYIVRGGQNSEFIRRESTALENFGRIGLGFSPDENPRQVIEFSVSNVVSY